MFKASQIQGEGSIIFFCKKNLNPFYWHIWCTKNHQKRNRIEKVMAPQSKGGQELQKKPPNATMADSQTPTKLFVCCSIVIKVPK
jgi:hypothetical protein